MGARGDGGRDAAENKVAAAGDAAGADEDGVGLPCLGFLEDDMLGIALADKGGSLKASAG